MNIYNDSQATSSANYPTSATFTNIETTNAIIHNSLAIDGLAKGSILIGEDNTNDVGALLLGLDKMVLCADTASGLPQWRNNITLDYIETNQIKIPTVIGGDLLVGQNSNFLARLPCGANNQVLYSNGTELGWQNKTAGNQYFYFPGSTGNISTVYGVIVGGNGFNLTAGRQYKMTVSANIVTTAQANFLLFLGGTQITNFSYFTNADMSRTFLYTATGSGAINIELYGLSSAAGNSIYEFAIFGSEF